MIGFVDALVVQWQRLLSCSVPVRDRSPSRAIFWASHGVFPQREPSSVCACMLGRRVPRFLGRSLLYLSVRSI
jgi:hypothetical protein